MDEQAIEGQLCVRQDAEGWRHYVQSKNGQHDISDDDQMAVRVITEDAKIFIIVNYDFRKEQKQTLFYRLHLHPICYFVIKAYRIVAMMALL
jgi:hypothetical protein